MDHFPIVTAGHYSSRECQFLSKNKDAENNVWVANRLCSLDIVTVMFVHTKLTLESDHALFVKSFLWFW